MNMDKVLQVLERMEKKIERIQKENRSIMEKLGIGAKEDSSKNMEPNGLTLLSMENILSYMDPSKRLCLWLFYPKVRPIEKRVPLIVNDLHISASEFSIDNISFQVHKDKRICRVVSEKEKEANPEVFVSVAENDYQQKCVDDFSKLCFDIFTGRRQFEVHNFQCKVLLPFELNMKVGRVTVDPGIDLFTKNYANITGKIEHVTILGLDGLAEPEELRLPWIRNVDRMEAIYREAELFEIELPNILANRICINCRNHPHVIPHMIISWCENKTRPVGSELILTMAPSAEDSMFFYVLRPNFYPSSGFVRRDDDSLCLPMDNNSEFVLRKNNDRHLFTPLYLESLNPENYFHLKVEHKQP